MRNNEPISEELEKMFKQDEITQEQIEKVKEDVKEKTLSLEKKETGFISPVILGSLICILSFVGMVLSYILYIVAG